MQILKSYIAAVTPNNETVGIVVENGHGGHKMIAMNQFDRSRDMPYLWGADDADRLHSGMCHYQEVYFGESMPAVREKHRKNISSEPWVLVIRQATIEL